MPLLTKRPKSPKTAKLFSEFGSRSNLSLIIYLGRAHSWIMEGIIFGVSKGLLANLLLQTSIVYIFFPNNRGFKRAVNPN